MVARIVTVFNMKGGAGKTTSAVNLAGTVGMRNCPSAGGTRKYRVLLVDGDEQATATIWNAQAPETSPFPAVVTNLADMGGKIHQEIRKQVDNYDLIVIDCPPALHSPIPSSAMLISDLALIPIIPSPGDIWAADKTKTLALDAQDKNESLMLRSVAVMIQENTEMTKESMKILEDDPKIPLMKATLGFRTAYKQSQAFGGTVHRIPGAAAAVVEVNAFVDEVLELLGLE